MNSSEVLGRFDTVKARYQVRDSEFDRIKDYLAGLYYDSQIRGTTLRDETKYRSLDGSILVTANLPYLTVQDNTALSTMDPIIEVPPKDETENSEKNARRIQKILYATYEHSGGINLMHDSSLYERAFGYSIMGAQPNLKDKRVDWTVYSPRYCYPVFKLGSRIFLRELFIRWNESPSAVKSMYPNYAGDTTAEDESVEMTVYFSETQKMIFAGDQMVSGITHNWGYVPFVVIPCMPTLDGFGTGDVHQTIGLAIFQNQLLSDAGKYINENVNGDTLMTTDDEVEAPVQIGGRKVWVQSPGTEVQKMIPTTGQMPEVFKLIADLQALHGSLTGTTAARQGLRDGQYVSAKGQAALQQPLGNRMDAGLKIKSQRLSILCEYTLKLYEKHFKDTKLDLYGRTGKSYYDITFKGSQIKGQYRTDICFLPVILSDASNRLIQGMQLHGGGFISKYTFSTRFMPDIIDPAYEAKQIAEETFAQAKLEAAAQVVMNQANQATAPQPGGALAGVPQIEATAAKPGNPDMVPFQNNQLEKGRTNETAQGLFAGMAGRSPSPAPASGAPPLQSVPGGALSDMAGPSPAGPPTGTIPEDVGAGLLTIEDLDARLEAIPKIKGRIFLTGIIVTAGTIDLAAGQKIEISLTNPLDKQTILNALRDIADSLVFTTVTDKPAPPVAEITPPGVTPKSTPPKVPPESAQMMGGAPPMPPQPMGGMA